MITNWYKIIKLARLQGEYWIQSGTAIFADGNIGDMNHEAYVIEAVRGSYGYESEMESWDDFLYRVGKQYAEEKEINIGDNLNESEEYSEYWALGDQFLLEQGMTEEELNIAHDRSNSDARLFAAKTLGWKRLEGNSVETWELTESDLRSISNGLYDAYNEDALNSKFNIYVFSTNKYYENVPYSEMEEGLLSIRYYLSR